jgi:hypothetical protein
MEPGWFLVGSSILSFGTKDRDLTELDICTDDVPPRFFKIIPDGNKLKIIPEG